MSCDAVVEQTGKRTQSFGDLVQEEMVRVQRRKLPQSVRVKPKVVQESSSPGQDASGVREEQSTTSLRSLEHSQEGSQTRRLHFLPGTQPAEHHHPSARTTRVQADEVPHSVLQGDSAQVHRDLTEGQQHQQRPSLPSEVPEEAE